MLFEPPVYYNQPTIENLLKEISAFHIMTLGNCESFSARDVDEQYIQKRAPTQWQVALILYILPSHCYQKGRFAIAYNDITERRE